MSGGLTASTADEHAGTASVIATPGNSRDEFVASRRVRLDDGDVARRDGTGLEQPAEQGGTHVAPADHHQLDTLIAADADRGERAHGCSRMSGRLGVSDFPDTPPGHPHWGPPTEAETEVGECSVRETAGERQLGAAARKFASTVTYRVPSTRSSSSAVQRVSGSLAAQVDGVLLTDREVGTDELVVAAQQQLHHVGPVLLGCRHHVRLVAQRALAEREPHGGEVLLVTEHAHVPARLAERGVVAGAPIDRGDQRIVGGELGEPGVDLRRAGRRAGEPTWRSDIGGSFAEYELAGGQIGVQPTQAGGGEAPRVAAGPVAAAVGHRPAASNGSSRIRAIALANSDRVALGTRNPVSPSSTSDSRPPTALATTGHAARRGFERDQTEALAAARDDDDVGGPVVRRQDVVRLRRHEPDLVVETELVDELMRPFDLAVAGRTAGAADDQQQCVGTTERVQRTDRDVGTLQRLDPTDEQQHRNVERQIERAACPARSPGAKNACSTPGATISI